MAEEAPLCPRATAAEPPVGRESSRAGQEGWVSRLRVGRQTEKRKLVKLSEPGEKDQAGVSLGKAADVGPPPQRDATARTKDPHTSHAVCQGQGGRNQRGPSVLRKASRGTPTPLK